MNNGPAARYRERTERFDAAAVAAARTASLLMQGRIIAFAAFVAAALLAEQTGSTLWTALAAAAILAFAALVALHRRSRAAEAWSRELADLNTLGLHRLARDWDRLPTRPAPDDVARHPYAADLDLHGRASLSQLLHTASSAAGVATLDRWLMQPAAPDMIRARQAAVQELASNNDLRDTLAVHAARTRAARASDVERFVSWAESDGWLYRHAGARVAAWLLPALTTILIVAHASGWTDRALWLLSLAAALAMYFGIGGRVRRTFDAAFGREALFTHYPPMIACVAAAHVESPLLRELQQRLVQQGEAADAQLDRLRRLMHLADLRLSSIHLPVFMLTMWDLHVLRALEKWQRAAGAQARDWLAAAGEFEALCALATLAHDHPDWAFPVITQDERSLRADGIGHPLLRDDVCVRNDVEVGPPGSFLLVTGSNMSGKSTLLRALGTNAVLAQAGAPCCARSLVMPPLRVCTSIRVQDSLARGVSYFMAELQRLKLIVDIADAPGDRVLFLLDEILHGTNTAERRIAATRVIRHLVDSGAIGAATTHDLELAGEPLLRPHAVQVHFQEEFTDRNDDGALRFDYRLREGPATSTNALKLMRIVGLDPGS